MTGKFKVSQMKPFLGKHERSGVDDESLIKEREQLLKALARTMNDRQHLQRRTNRLFAKAKSLNRVLAQCHQDREYLKREE